MTRCSLLTPSELDDDRRLIYESIVAGPRASGPFRLVEDDGSLTGPFAAMLLAPNVGGALSRLGEAIRYQSSLDARTREIAILAVAALRRNDYEWYAHERVGRALGMSPEELDALKHGAEPEYPRHELDVLRATRSVACGEPIEAESFERLRSQLGEDGIAELVTLVGYYTTLAMLIEVFEISVPRGEAAVF